MTIDATHYTYAQQRLALGLTQAQLATILGVTRETINRRESGKAEVGLEAMMALWHLERLSPEALQSLAKPAQEQP